MDIPVISDIVIESSNEAMQTEATIQNNPNTHQERSYKDHFNNKALGFCVIAAVGAAISILLSSWPERWYVGLGMFLGSFSFYLSLNSPFYKDKQWWYAGFIVSYLFISFVWSLGISQPTVNNGLATICAFILFFIVLGSCWNFTIFSIPALIWSLFAIYYSIKIESM